MIVRAAVATVVAAFAVLVSPTVAADAAGSVAISVPIVAYPGLPDPMSVSGLTPNGEYILSGAGVSFSPADVTADSSGSATSSLLVPGDTSPSGVEVAVTAAGGQAPVATRFVQVGTPHMDISTDTPWPAKFDVYGFAAGEPLDVTYSNPQIGGPASITAAQTPIRTWTNLTGAPGVTAVPFTVTVTGHTYGRTVSASGSLPAYRLAAGQSLAVDPSPTADEVLLATSTHGSELIDEVGQLEIEYNVTSTSVTVGNSGIEASTIGCTSAALTMQTDGNLVLSCLKNGTRSNLWTSGTSGTGTGNRLVLRSDGTMAVYTAAGRVVWWSPYGRIWPIELDRGQSMTRGDQLRPSAADPYSRRAVLNAVGELTAIGVGTWVSPAAGTGARLTLQTDGNLVLRTATGHAAWATGTAGSGATRLIMQSDGNLTLRTPSGAVVWGSWTNRTVMGGTGMSAGSVLSADGRLTNKQFSAYLTDAGRFVVRGQRTYVTPTAAGNGAYLAMQTDGNLVLYTRYHRAVWSSHTSANRHGEFVELVLTYRGDLEIFVRGQRIWSSHTN